MDQGLLPAFAGQAPPAAIARAGVGYPDPPASDTFCRELVTTRAGEAKAFGVISTPLRAHRVSLAFARLTAEDPIYTRSLGFKGRLLRSSAKKSAIRRTQGVFHRGPLSGAMGPQLGKPSQASSSPGR